MDEEHTEESSEQLDSFTDGLNHSTVSYQNQKLANTYKFKKFNLIEDLKERKNFSITVTAKRNTGKSVLTRDLCSHMIGWFNQVYVFSLTANLQPDLFDFVDPDNVINSFNENLLIKLWEQQEQLVLKMKAAKVKEDEIPRMLIIFDDLIADPKVRNSTILKRIFIASRHVKISLIFLTQSFVGIPPVMRVNTDVAICFYLDSQDNREAFAKQYLSTRSTKVGMLILEKITTVPYQALFALNYITDPNPEHTVRTYIANPKIKKFKMCKDKLKYIHTFPSQEETAISWLPPISKNKSKIKYIC
jgi:phenylalanyl-tRNA synthetase alpha subunit